MTAIAEEQGERESRKTTPEEPPPSKSARKRGAHAAQALGEQLIELPDGELVALALPEPLVTAVREARGIVSRSASARQRQLIGRLMREIDPRTVEAALAERRQRATLQSRRFQHLESWRARLVGQDSGAALRELEAQYPQIDRPGWERAIAAARAERAGERGSAGASRQLFRMLRALLERS